MNLRIIHKNIFNDYSSLGMVNGAEQAGFPLTNMKTEVKTSTFRSDTLSDPEFEVTWSSARKISGVALAFTNLIAGSTMRVRLYSAESGGSLLYDNVVTLSDSVDNPQGFTSINSITFNYGGGVHLSSFFTEISGVKRANIILTSAGNTNGYVEIGRMVIGESFEPDDNANYGARVGFDDTTKQLRSSSGNLKSNRGTISRFIEFEMGDMSENDNFSLLNLFRKMGKSQPMFISLIPKTNIDKSNLDLQLYGLIAEDFTDTLAAYNIYSGRVKLVEI